MPKTALSRPRCRAAAIALGLVASLALTACGGGTGANLPDGVVARIGDAQITEKQLDRAVLQAGKEAAANSQTLPTEGQEGFDQVRQQSLATLISQRIIDFEARDCGTPCAVSEADITKDIARITAESFNDSPKEFTDFLKQRSISMADARAIVKNGLQQGELFTFITRGVRFDDADAKTYYDANPTEFTVAEARRTFHILVETEAEADGIRAEVTPENFAEIAKARSTDPSAKQNSGDLGNITPGSFVPEFEKAALALADGEISQPVKTTFGWHIIHVRITPASTTSFADAKAQIIAAQLVTKRNTTYQTWGEGIIEKWEGRTVYASDDLKPPEPDSGAETAPDPGTSTPATPAAP